MKLEFHGLSKQFDQGRMILQPMDFCDEIHTLAIIGPSGGENLRCCASLEACCRRLPEHFPLTERNSPKRKKGCKDTGRNWDLYSSKAACSVI